MSLLYDPKLKPPNESTAAGTDDDVLVLFEFDPEFTDALYASTRESSDNFV